MANVQKYGTTSDGQDVYLITLTNDRGMFVRLISYGSTLTECWVPDRNGRLENVLLGLQDIAAYEKSTAYFGSTIGPFANRLKGGHFELNGERYQTEPNEGENTLHGGRDGFSFRNWSIVEVDRMKVKLRLVNEDGISGFPGKLTVYVTFKLDYDNSLRIDYFAYVEHKPTVINLTTHPYFNLSGHRKESATSHALRINAQKYLPVDQDLIPLGWLEDVDGTPFDFRKPTVIETQLRTPHSQWPLTGGLDHCYVLDQPTLGVIAAHLHDPSSGRSLTIETTEPGLQVYTGNHLDNESVSPDGQPYEPGDGIALETQHFPDSPNRPEFPSTALSEGEQYLSSTIFRFQIL